ncbi:unnamed protein product [Phytophthora fragariaefolia]|uniref:Unnamed protein product n=1 Tax=Phytophthora fragariaefolia TaxID=1490495 RepID=A0A9W7CYL3_9STRA|nr:unnamed protein product [Phytophthora fragariaefolia]
MKQGCKLLINSLQLEELRVEIQRMHYHYLRQEFGKSKDAKKQAPVVRAAAPASNPTSQGDSKSKPGHCKRGAAVAAAIKPQQRQPPSTCCWVCKGQHWLDDRPTASDAEKESARQKMTEMRSSRRQVKRWRLRGYAAGDDQSVRLNGLIDVPFCPDSEADANVVPRRVIDDLIELQSDVRLEPLQCRRRRRCMLAELQCVQRKHIWICALTQQRGLSIYQVPCTVLDADTDEFLLGKITLRSLGIDMGRMIEQLAVAPNLDDSNDGRPPDSVFGIIDAGAHAELEPLKVQLKADAVLYRCKTRSFPPLQQQFLREYTKELEDRGLIRKNNLSRWASAVVPVKKPGTQGEFRMTVDYRRLNAMTVPIAGAAPNLSVVTSSVRGSRGFASFDLHKDVWQMGLHADSQEMFSFMTPDAIYTPTRVPQGATDSALHFQNQMQFMFDPLLYNAVLIWIDDVILFAKTVEEFLQALRKFFELLREFNLKLNIMKRKLFQLQARWCGRLISGDGVAHDPQQVNTLKALPLPQTTGDLQYFLCAANWLRDSIVDFARHAAPLHAKLDAALKGTSRRRQQALRIPLVWSDDEKSAYIMMLERIGASTPLAFPDPGKQICVFSDASDVGYAIVVTQVADWKNDLPIHATLRPLEDGAFDWPSNESLADVQQKHVRSAPPDHTMVEGLVCVDGKPWIPVAAKRLLARILVVAHAGSQGHRGEQAMLNAMSRFALDDATGIIKRFVRTCLLYKHVKGPHAIQRPWGPTLKCSRRNEVLHWDFLSLTPSHGDLRYVLVLKDDLIHFCELVGCSSPTAFVAAEAIMDWYKRFGSP